MRSILQEEYMKLLKNCNEYFGDKESKIIKKLYNQEHVNMIVSTQPTL